MFRSDLFAHLRAFLNRRAFNRSRVRFDAEYLSVVIRG
jgi:hypothetical protein